MKNVVDKVVVASREAFDKVGSAVQKFSDQSVIRIEKKQFETLRGEKISALGQKAADLFIRDRASEMKADDPEVAALIKEIKRLGKEIDSREKLLNAVSKDSKDSKDSKKEEK